MEVIKSQKLASLRDVPRAESNPYILELKGRMYLQPRANTIVAKGQEIIDTTTGEVIEDSVLMGRRKVVDKSQFAKLYASEVGVLFELSKPAVNVFIHLTKVMDYENKAIFDYNREYSKLGYKSNVPPLKGLRELLSKGIIYAHTLDGLWWLNPTIVCKGERFAMYTEYVTKERHEKDMEARRVAEKQMREQGANAYNSLDEQTQMQINAMNQQAERRYYEELREGQGRDMFSGEVVDLTLSDD